MFNSKKGNMFLILVVAMLTIFTVAVIYIVFTEPWLAIYNVFAPNSTSEFYNTSLRIKSTWAVWPIIMIFSIILWAFVSAIKGGDNTGGYV